MAQQVSGSQKMQKYPNKYIENILIKKEQTAVQRRVGLYLKVQI